MSITEQIDREIEAIERKGLSINNIDILYKLAVARSNCISLHDKNECAESATKTEIYQNGVYDKDINTLYISYVESRKSFCMDQNEFNRTRMIERLNELFAELGDLIDDIWSSAMCMDERTEIEKMIRKVSQH